MPGELGNKKNGHAETGYYLLVQRAVKHKYHQALQRVRDGKYVFEEYCIRVKSQKTECPRDPEQRKRDDGRLYSRADFLKLSSGEHDMC